MTRLLFRQILICLPWLALLAWMVKLSWFLCDDAFISFRYVRNLVEGHGIVFNPGEYVEGYTNFLWVLELAAIWGGLGLRPEQASLVLSVAYTLGTVAVVCWWILRTTPVRDRALVTWMALGILCSNASFAVWTTSGLETRQFTFFIILAIVCLALRSSHHGWLWATSLSLAAATYTRPEGLMLASLCFAYYACYSLATRAGIDRRKALILVGPFVGLVVLHYTFRQAYYGEWLPNTYYAKHLRPWYESGFRYIVAASIETGLYILLPLTAIAARYEIRRHGRGIVLLILACVLAHMSYLLRIGGDHFEFRPLDFYWPLLAVPTATVLVQFGREMAGGLATLPRLRSLGPTACTLVLFVPVLVYSGVIQGTLLIKAAKKRGRAQTGRLHIELNKTNARALLAIPGMPMFVAISNDMRKQCISHAVGARFAEHREFGKLQRANFKAYESLGRGVIPPDAVMALAAVGIMPFYIPDLRFIDTLGLVDATVAHHEVARPNHERVIAHDRWPPPNYLQERGVNFMVYAVAKSEAVAQETAQYAIEFGHELWMPFDVGDHVWANERFASHSLLARHHFSQDAPEANRLSFDGKQWRGQQFLGRFEQSLDAWQVVQGDAISNHSDHKIYDGQIPVFGHVGPGFLTTYHPSRGDTALGKIRSPMFIAKADQSLAFLLGGGSGSGLALRLLADGRQVASWRGKNVEALELTVYNLQHVAGKRLTLELVDGETGDWGHLVLDHVLLVTTTK